MSVWFLLELDKKGVLSSVLVDIILQSLPCSLLAVAVVVACRTLMEVQPFFPVSLRAILPDEEHQQMYWAGFLIRLVLH